MLNATISMFKSTLDITIERHLPVDFQTIRYTIQMHMGGAPEILNFSKCELMFHSGIKKAAQYVSFVSIFNCLITIL